MPIYIIIDGIRIYVYANDHVPPHVHAIYGEFEALISIKTQEVLDGYLPKRQLAKAKLQIFNEKEELLEIFYLLNPNIEMK